MINCEPHHVAVEGLGGIDIRNGNTDDLQSVIHQTFPFSLGIFEVESVGLRLCLRQERRSTARGRARVPIRRIQQV
jgi:hypothetical protein